MNDLWWQSYVRYVLKKTALSDWAGRNTTTIMDFCIMFLNENL